MTNHFKLHHLLLAGLATLGACSSVVQVKDVTADQDGYLRQKFATSEVSPAVVAKLPKTGGGSFSHIVLTRQVNTESSDGKKETGTAVTTYTDGGNGIVYYRIEHAMNGIPYGQTYASAYKGVLVLRSQLVPLRQQSTTALYEIKEIVAITPFPTDIGKTFSVKYKTGSTMQIANYSDAERACTTVRRFPAAELHAKLGGTATELDCEERTNNSVRSRGKWAMLEQYGFAVQVESTSATSKATYRITDVSGA